MVRTGSKSGKDLDVKPLLKPKDSTVGNGRGEKWTGEDRKALCIYVEKYGAGNWTAAAACVPGKSAKQEEIIPLYTASLSGCLEPVWINKLELDEENRRLNQGGPLQI